MECDGIGIENVGLPMSDRSRALNSLRSSIVTLQVYIPLSPSIRYSNRRRLVKPLPLEVVGLMVILLSLIIEPPPGPVQLIVTELSSTPIASLTVQIISSGLPTISWLLRVSVLTIKVGTKHRTTN